MFAFDVWADWLKSEAIALEGNDLRCIYGDTISIPECASNPAFSLEVSSPERLGRICYWHGGTCDYGVFDIEAKEFVANETMLEANDKTVTTLFAQFISLMSLK